MNKYDNIQKILDQLEKEITEIEQYMPESEINSIMDWNLESLKISLKRTRSAFNSFVESANKKLRKKLDNRE